MSTISSVSSTNPYQNPAVNNTKQTFQDFQAIGTALQSGDLSSAQSALTSFQQTLANSGNSSSQASSTQPFGKNSQANNDYQNLVSALQSGNLSSAQQSYTSLQNDLKTSQAKGHHHRHHSSATEASSTANTGGTSGTTTSTTGGTGSLLNVSA